MNIKNIDLKLIPPTILIIGGISLLQYHSIQFWSEYAGVETGWAWSLLLEIVCLWLASLHKKVMTTLALIASILLLASPLYWVGSEAINHEQTRIRNMAQINEHETRETTSFKESKELIKSLIEEDKAQIRQYLKNSDTRSQWSPLITKAKKDLSEHIKELQTLLKDRASLKPTNTTTINKRGSTFGIILQCLVLILIQISDLIAIRYIAKRLDNQTTPIKQDKINHLSCTIMTLRLKDKLKKDKIPSYDHLCKKVEINRRQLGLLMNTKDENKNPDQTFPNKMTYHKIKEYLGEPS